MARPSRFEFNGGLYHVTSRGDCREDIYSSNKDRLDFLHLLSESVARYNWKIHAYCLMDNHYHLLVETPDANLSRGMRHLNSVYTQKSNKNNHRVGHVFQGRFKAIIVDRDDYLLELARYIVLNPVRARMVQEAKQWPWSSYRSTAGITATPDWLSTDFLLSSIGNSRKTAQRLYEEYVNNGKDQPSLWESLRNQVVLGSEAFAEETLSRLDTDKDLREIPNGQTTDFRT